MPARILYLNDAAGPGANATLRQLVTVAPAGAADLGPGIFTNASPGGGIVNAGQWFPSVPQDDGDDAVVIDTGATTGPGTNRAGWYYNQDLTGYVLSAGAWSLQLRLQATVGANELGRLLMRVSVVRGIDAGGPLTTVCNLFTGSIAGGTLNVSGRDGWRDQNEARITVAGAAANYAVTIAGAAQSIGHRFVADERILIELGFGDASNATDRVWHLLYDNGLSFVTTPTIDLAAAAQPYHVRTNTSATTTASPGFTPPDDPDGNGLWVVAFVINSNAALTGGAGWELLTAFNNTAAERVEIWTRQAIAGVAPSYQFTKANDGVLTAAAVSLFRTDAVNSRVVLEPTAPSQSANPSQDAIDYATFDPAVACAVVAYGFYQNDDTYWAGPVIAGVDPVLWNFLGFSTSTGADASILGFIGDSTGAATGARTQATNSSADAVNAGVILGLVAEALTGPTGLTRQTRAPYLSQRMRRARQRWG